MKERQIVPMTLLIKTARGKKKKMIDQKNHGVSSFVLGDYQSGEEQEKEEEEEVETLTV